MGAVCCPLVLECDLQLAVLFLQLGLILLLLFFFLLFHLLHRTAAQYLKDHYKQDVTDQRPSGSNGSDSRKTDLSSVYA